MAAFLPSAMPGGESTSLNVNDWFIKQGNGESVVKRIRWSNIRNTLLGERFETTPEKLVQDIPALVGGSIVMTRIYTRRNNLIFTGGFASITIGPGFPNQICFAMATENVDASLGTIPQQIAITCQIMSTTQIDARARMMADGTTFNGTVHATLLVIGY
ncbi:MAG: hypothetical protein HC883_01455 [Bdellovibrionaceae bacterium]|nr:hypothetical protein [Pseudobdellovibrionaceae bacterium]